MTEASTTRSADAGANPRTDAGANLGADAGANLGGDPGPDLGADAGADLVADLGAAVARLPECLADQRARERLLAVARLLPAELATGPLGLEIRLAGPPAVDAFAAAVPGSPAFDALIAALARPRTSPGWADPRRAVDLADALARWQQGTGSLPRVARYLLVEADASAEPGAPPPVPSIFLAPRGHHDRPRPGQPPNAFQRRVEDTTTAAAELLGTWPDPAIAAALAHLVATLPAGSDIFAVGAMISRATGSALRVAVRRLPADAITSVLSAVGFARQGDLLARAAADAAMPTQAIAFELGPGAERRVGLELSPAEDWKQASLADWPRLLAFVVDRGVAEAARADAVPGLVDPSGDPLWGLAHVKLAADDRGMLPVAKLYVGLLRRSAFPPPGQAGIPG